MGLDVQINDKYKITSDPHGVSIMKKAHFDKKNNEFAYKPVGHYACVEHALKWLINKAVLDSDCKTLNEILDLIDNYKKLIDSHFGNRIPDYTDSK